MTNNNLQNILDNLPDHYVTDEGSNNYNFFKSFADSMDKTDLSTDSLSDNIFISTSSGIYLDKIAYMFDIIRGNLNDEDLRSKIIATASNSLGGGTAESLRTLLANSLNIDIDKINIVDTSTLIFDVELEIDDDIDISILNNARNIIIESKAAGTFFDKLDIISINDIWRVNISEVNSGDLIL